MTGDGLYDRVEIHAVVGRGATGTAGARRAIRMWVGIFDREPVSTLTWSIDGVDVPSEKVRTIRALAPIATGGGGTSTWTGIVELTYEPRPEGISGVRPSYRIQARATWPGRPAASSRSLSVRPLPDRVPTGLGHGFTVLLVSCFYERHDSSGRAGEVVDSLTRGPDRPDLVLTVGDQVYLDAPWWNPILPRVPTRDLAKKFEEKYRKNWQSLPAPGTGYADILRAAPVAAIPDDHEYWNNHPLPGAVWPGTWTGGSRENWTAAARDLYDHFQHGDRPEDPSTYCYAIDVEPLSFFMLDTRTFRSGTARRMSALLDVHLDTFRAWVDRMVGTPGSVPVLVTAPSLFQDRKGVLARMLDLNLANLTDYPALVDGILRLSEAGRSPLLLTGDVHYPRLSRAVSERGSRSRPWGPMYEVVSSPTSLVAGKHARSPTGTVPTQDTRVPAKVSCETLWPPKDQAPIGNHVALLRFSRLSTGVELALRYYTIGAGPSAPSFVDAPRITLRNAAEAGSG